MSQVLGRDARARVCELIASLGYQRLDRRGHTEVFEHPETGHRAQVIPYPRWGHRIDILTVDSSFPLPPYGRATAFQLDLRSQISPSGDAEAGRWRPAELEQLVAAHVVGYLDRARSPGDILDMLLDGDIRPVGSVRPRAMVQHGYHLLKWWQLADRLDSLREVAERVPIAEQAEMRRAPWGRTELAEVLWYGRGLPEPPPRLPWGPGDQGDPRAEAWFRDARRRTETSDVPDAAQELSRSGIRSAGAH